MNAPDLTRAIADATTRAAVVTELRRLALVAEQCGNRAELRGMYKLASSNWQVAAQRTRAANALAAGPEFDPRDRRYVETAAAHVRDRACAAELKAQVAP